jgi:hypothetical protein
MTVIDSGDPEERAHVQPLRGVRLATDKTIIILFPCQAQVSIVTN